MWFSCISHCCQYNTTTVWPQCLIHWQNDPSVCFLALNGTGNELIDGVKHREHGRTIEPDAGQVWREKSGWERARSDRRETWCKQQRRHQIPREHNEVTEMTLQNKKPLFSLLVIEKRLLPQLVTNQGILPCSILSGEYGRFWIQKTMMPNSVAALQGCSSSSSSSFY